MQLPYVINNVQLGVTNKHILYIQVYIKYIDTMIYRKAACVLNYRLFKRKLVKCLEIQEAVYLTLCLQPDTLISSFRKELCVVVNMKMRAQHLGTLSWQLDHNNA